MEKKNKDYIQSHTKVSEQVLDQDNWHDRHTGKKFDTCTSTSI